MGTSSLGNETHHAVCAAATDVHWRGTGVMHRIPHHTVWTCDVDEEGKYEPRMPPANDGFVRTRISRNTRLLHPANSLGSGHFAECTTLHKAAASDRAVVAGEKTVLVRVVTMADTGGARLVLARVVHKMLGRIHEESWEGGVDCRLRALRIGGHIA